MNVRITYAETICYDVDVRVDPADVRAYLAGLTGTGTLPDSHEITNDELRSFVDDQGISAFLIVRTEQTRGEQTVDIVAVHDALEQ